MSVMYLRFVYRLRLLLICVFIGILSCSSLFGQEFIPRFKKGIYLNSLSASAKTSEPDTMLVDSFYYQQAVRCEGLTPGDPVFYMVIGFGERGYGTGTQGAARLSDGTNVTPTEFALSFDFRYLTRDSLFLSGIRLPNLVQGSGDPIYLTETVEESDTFYVHVYPQTRPTGPMGQPMFSFPFTLNDLADSNHELFFPDRLKIPGRIYIGFTVNGQNMNDTLAFFTGNPIRNCGSGLRRTFCRLTNVDTWRDHQTGWFSYSSLFRDGYDANIIFMPILEYDSQPASRSESENLRLSVYPQPANEVCNLRLPQSGTLILSDLNGKEYFRQTCDEGDVQINVQNLSEGLYLLKLESHNGLFFGKISVIR